MTMAADQGVLEALPLLLLKRRNREDRHHETHPARRGRGDRTGDGDHHRTGAGKVFVGNLVDYTGATSSTGKFSGPGKEDAIRWLNQNGGITGKHGRGWSSARVCHKG